MWKIEYNSRDNPRNTGFLPVSRLPTSRSSAAWLDLCGEFSSIAFALNAVRVTDFGLGRALLNNFNFRARNTITNSTVYLVYNGETDNEALEYIQLENTSSNNYSSTISTPTEETMPQPAQTDLPLQPLQHTHEPAPLVSVNITRHKPTHRLILQINAKPLHDLLDAIGVPHDHGVYTERPSSSIRIASGNTLSTEIFLKREYPVTIDLSTVLTAPVAHSRLEELANSSQAAVAKILEFYQPVDIQISVVPKAVKDK